MRLRLLGRELWNGKIQRRTRTNPLPKAWIVRACVSAQRAWARAIWQDRSERFSEASGPHESDNNQSTGTARANLLDPNRLRECERRDDDPQRLGREKALCVEAQVLMLSQENSTNKQPSSNQEKQGQRDLACDQYGPQTAQRGVDGLADVVA